MFHNDDEPLLGDYEEQLSSIIWLCVIGGVLSAIYAGFEFLLANPLILIFVVVLILLLIFIFRKKIQKHKEEIQEKIMMAFAFLFAIALLVGFFALLIFLI